MGTKGLSGLLEPLTIWLLSRVGQPWSEDFFNASARINPLTAVYCAVLRERDGRIEILLTDRNDKTYRNKVHVPGSMVRNSDPAGSLGHAIGRVLNGELHQIGWEKVTLADVTLSDAPRGQNIVKEVSVVMVVELRDGEETTIGKWYDTDNLPSNHIAHEGPLAQVAVKKFREMHKI